MPIVLFRVDERLIHGQVVVGWGERLNADRMVVVDDQLSQSPWEQELYCLGVPPTVDAVFFDVSAARQHLPDWAADTRRIVVLVRDVDTLARIAEDGRLRDIEINLGGIHHAAPRAKVLPYIFLSPEEREQLRRMAEDGVEITARDLPSSRAVPLAELLDQTG